MNSDRSESTAVSLAGEDIHWDQDLSYGEYLGLSGVLNAQHPRTDHHDEMLFIIIHQVSELWLKLSIHELTAAVEQVRRDELRPAFKMLSRVSRIQHQLIQGWEVLSTMTPADYLKFRDQLGESSGFQSYQYRTLEFMLGNKNAAMIEVHRANPDVYGALKETLNAPSFYDETLRLLWKRGFDIPASHRDRDWAAPYVPNDAVEAAWAEIYGNVEKYWDLYELAEKLVDVEYHFQQWRFSHLKTVERIIGRKRGTGGTAGVGYLVKALNLKFFPELWSVRTAL
ncbi:MAG: tryptophan 2,3-dioxygenase [Alphaproteobacteria bacterium]|nr:MAG: tryptophan 2,3-dioxygenase [Alphaproteobacteria bacterium]